MSSASFLFSIFGTNFFYFTKSKGWPFILLLLNFLSLSNGTNNFTQNLSYPPEILCKGNICQVGLYVNKSQIKTMVNDAALIFLKYQSNDSIDVHRLEQLFADVGLAEKSHEEHRHKRELNEDHDEEDHDEEDHDEEDHDEDHHEDHHHDECPLLEEIEEDYNSGVHEIQLRFHQFFTILPKLLLNKINSKYCDLGKEQKPDLFSSSASKVWGTALGCVAVISLLSLIGLMTVPVMKNSILYNRIISFLTSIAVGTLVGDAILHLLPHALSNTHEHSHNTSTIYKNLTIVVGMYLFFVFESTMTLRRKIKEMNKHFNNQQNPITIDSQDSSIGVLLSNGETKIQPNDSGNCESMQTGISDGIHTCNHHSPDTFFIKGGGVKDMAWMVIAGDGLHNFSDGLAIGAAFSSTIAAGCSTSLAILFHELPHEFGDFAILLEAGMSVKQALTYNFLCACMAFIGCAIGISLGEYVADLKMWILALTAGGFLYVALVDMLPSLIKQISAKDLMKFFLVHFGIVIGIGGMLIIALYEESLEKIF